MLPVTCQSFFSFSDFNACYNHFRRFTNTSLTILTILELRLIIFDHSRPWSPSLKTFSTIFEPLSIIFDHFLTYINYFRPFSNYFRPWSACLKTFSTIFRDDFAFQLSRDKIYPFWRRTGKLHPIINRTHQTISNIFIRSADNVYATSL